MLKSGTNEREARCVQCLFCERERCVEVLGEIARTFGKLEVLHPDAALLGGRRERVTNFEQGLHGSTRQSLERAVFLAEVSDGLTRVLACHGGAPYSAKGVAAFETRRGPPVVVTERSEWPFVETVGGGWCPVAGCARRRVR